jgi:hypothetical protein
MRKLVLLTAGAALAACTTAPPQDSRAAAQQQLAQLLAGKVAGAPVECIPNYHSSSPSVITPTAIAFQATPGRIYVSNTVGSGCEGVGGPAYSLATTQHGSSTLCAGDIVQIRDLQAGTMAGSCSLTQLVPYTTP